LQKISVYHFHNGTGGGVLSVIRNLVRFSNNPLIENHIIYTINKLNTPVFSIEHIEGAVTEKIFYYSPKWNFYYTCRQLAKCLPDDRAVLVTHDWLELGMISNLGLQNHVITFIHGDYDYYYQLAQLHQEGIDKFIVIAKDIGIKLQALLPARKKDIYYLRFPVPDFNYVKREQYLNNIVFIGRLTEEKGYHLLPEIDRLLRVKNIRLNWHIVGEGNKSIAGWDDNRSIKWHGKMGNKDVLALLQYMDYFILPSLAEGMPVALIEAMKAGVIPFVNNINGGIQEIIKDNETGFKISKNMPAAFAACIGRIVENKELVAAIRNNCVIEANKLFNPQNNTELIEDEICKSFFAPVKNKNIIRAYGSRLDQKWLPNLVTKAARNIK
jgi:glycosyltransferase involved in cell wall biosynthesis